MGTNYYLVKGDVCPECGAAPERLHMGKSSAGWVYLLRIHVDEGIHNLQDWLRVLRQKVMPDTSTWHIEDEYGRVVEPDAWLGTVLLRHWRAQGLQGAYTDGMTFEVRDREFS